MHKLALPAAALAALLAFSSPVAATGAYGVGSLVFPGCPSDTVPIVGVEDGAGGWVFVVGDLHTTDPGCAWADGGVFDGAWNPAVGGCLPSNLSVGVQLCLRFPVAVAEGIRYDARLSAELGGAITGTVTLTFV